MFTPPASFSWVQKCNVQMCYSFSVKFGCCSDIWDQLWILWVDIAASFSWVQKSNVQTCSPALLALHQVWVLQRHLGRRLKLPASGIQFGYFILCQLAYFWGRLVQCADVLSAECSIWGRLILPACQIIVATRNGPTHHHIYVIYKL